MHSADTFPMLWPQIQNMRGHALTETNSLTVLCCYKLTVLCAPRRGGAPGEPRRLACACRRTESRSRHGSLSFHRSTHATGSSTAAVRACSCADCRSPRLIRSCRHLRSSGCK
eukprot:6202755-Pleurochrysis_carterae.AAC.3